MTNPLLESAWAKLNRAREHVKAQKSETDKIVNAAVGIDLVDADPDAVPLTFAVEPDPNGGDGLRLRVASLWAFDLRVSTIIGDAMNNFRGALDHVAWAIYQRSGKRVREAAERQVEFPIHLDQADFDSSLSRRIPGINDEQETVVRGVQPYRRGKAAKSDPLWTLARFNNFDKHRELRPLLLMPMLGEIRTNPRTSGCRVLDVRPGPDYRRPLHVDAVVLLVRVSVPNRCQLTVHMEAEPTVVVGPSDVLLIQEGIQAIETTIKNMLTELDGLL